ncbi:MAG: alanine--glyoxylate aminotransferase family protein [Candidatus Heimdallarchaeota archaeon]|nr:MAG: alanine--glyoxylate aminotransferase family protein [Candidatus Heimdallarchaeota archaeon]
MIDEKDFLDLYIPGPVNVSKACREKLALPMIAHRSETMGELHQDIASYLQKMLFTDNQIILSTSSSTGLMEAAIRNCVHEKGVLNVLNGAFAERWHAIAQMNGKKADTLNVDWGKAVSPQELNEKLDEKEYDAVCITQNETSTGVTTPIKDLYKIIKDHDCLLLVDAVSSAGGVETRVDDWEIDVYLFGLQKCMALPPGLAVASVSDTALKMAETVPNRGWYFDFLYLKKYHDRNGMQPATPVTPIYYALQYQLHKIVDIEGIENRWARHSEMGEYTRNWVKNKKLTLFADKAVASNTVTCVNSLGVNVTQLKADLMKQGYLFATGYGKFKEKNFRIAHMGDRNLNELKTYLQTIDELIS